MCRDVCRADRTVYRVWWWLLPLVVAAGVCGAASARFVVTRGSVKPVSFDAEAELAVIAGVWTDPSRWAYLTEIAPSDFASGTWRGVWDAMCHAGSSLVGVPATEEQARLAASSLADQSQLFVAAVRSRVSDRDAMLLDSLAPHDDDAVMKSAAIVMSSRAERVTLTGASLIVPSSTPDSIHAHTPPVVRVPAPLTRTRVVVSALVAMLWASTSAAVVSANSLTGVASFLTVVAWLALGVGMFVVAFVDYDTMYIDMPFWAFGTAAAWLAVLGSALVAGTWDRVLAGAVMVVAVAVVFEGLNLFYRLLRGHDGQGFGDTLIVIGTVGIPPALTGQWASGYVSVMAAMVAAIAAWAFTRARGSAGRDTPFAFGPWLALGPVVALWWAAL